MAPPRPASSEPPKRIGGTPQQLAKLDLDLERQKSAKLTLTKKKIKASELQDDGAGTTPSPTSGVGTTKKKTASKEKSTLKATKSVKVAVATAGEDQFNDIGELSKAPINNTGKLPTKAKPRPASAGVGPVKPATAVRPSSAGTPSLTKTKPEKPGSAPTQKPLDRPSRKLAFTDSQQSDDAVSEADENELAAKGIYYDVFVQTRRCETLCYEVGLKLQHIRKMKKKFDDNDMYHTGEITQAEFFYIINEERRPLTKGILQYANVAPDQKFLSFDEFLLCIVSFAVLTPPEVYQYAFDLYDADRSGSLDEYEFAKMSKEMQSKQFSFPKNTQMAINMISGQDTASGKRGSYVSEDGLVALGEFMKFAKLFPMAFFPLRNFQKNVRKATLGESKWSKFAARKLKLQELVSHMRRNDGAIPELSLTERLWSLVDDDVIAVRKRAAEIYGIELNQRRLIGDPNADENPGEK